MTIPAPNTQEAVQSLILSAHAHFRAHHFALAEADFEQALTQQRVVDPSSRLCLDILMDLANVADLRGRSARQAWLLQQAVGYLLGQQGDSERAELISARPRALLTTPKSA